MVGGGNRPADLDRWLEPFLSVMGRKTRRTWAPCYLRGLLGPGERKSLLPMAERLGLSGHDQLQHFVASTAYVVDRVVKDFRAPSREVAIMAWQAWALTKGGDVGAMHYVNRI